MAALKARFGLKPDIAEGPKGAKERHCTLDPE
jgi:hypothetical protein